MATRSEGTHIDFDALSGIRLSTPELVWMMTVHALGIAFTMTGEIVVTIVFVCDMPDLQEDIAQNSSISDALMSM
jgi:hypothetical protein